MEQPEAPSFAKYEEIGDKDPAFLAVWRKMSTRLARGNVNISRFAEFRQ